MVGACASPRKVIPDGGRDSGTNTFPDLATPDVDFSQPSTDDLSSTDLSGVDLFAVDLSSVDLRGTPDLRGQDAGPADMAAPPPDLTTSTCMPPVSGGTCDTNPQCGCSGGLNCSVVNNTTGVTGCVATGSTGPWSNCTGNGAGQCGIGYTCVDGVCALYCNTVADCPGAYHACGQVTSAGTPIPGFLSCSQLCDPVTPTLDNATFDPCGPNVFCYPSTDGISFCAGPTTPTGTQGADCTTSDTNCAAGYICLQDSAVSYSCYKYCHTGSNADCTGGRICYAFATAEYAANKQIGYCDF